MRRAAHGLRKNGNHLVKPRDLFIERLRGGRSFLHQRRILLGNLVDLADRLIDFLNALTLRIRGRGDLLDNTRDAANRPLYFSGSPARL